MVDQVVTEGKTTWRISRWAGPHDDGGAVIVDDAGKRIASTESIWWKADKHSWDEYHGNARLIAAAPEMASALDFCPETGGGPAAQEARRVLGKAGVA